MIICIGKLNLKHYIKREMKIYTHLLLLLSFTLQSASCNAQKHKTQVVESKHVYQPTITGAENTSAYFDSLKGKRIALMVNQTSLIGTTHLVDSLLAKQLTIVKIFAPEHGFRGTADAGEKIKSGVDEKTGIPIVSLYGAKLKPDSNDLKNVDIVVYDIQDVGARCFTYISSLYYLMEACADNQLPLLVLDRPNPNIQRVDGPMLQQKYRSFVSLLPVPLLYGLTVGELAKMIVGERWLSTSKPIQLLVVPCLNYTRNSVYDLPVKPSPNLPNSRAIYLYPSLVFFEGTNVSVGRGTDFPFQVFGAPEWKGLKFKFTPKSVAGATSPPFLNQECFGYDLQNTSREFDVENNGLNLQYLITAYKNASDKKNFFLKNGFVNKLAGYDLKSQIEIELSIEEIRGSWKKGLEQFKQSRIKYFLYPEI